MDELGGSSIQEKGGGGEGGAGGAWSDAGGATPLPPVFGNANAQGGDALGDMGFKGINLDDVFSGVFFSPEGDLLDIPSEDDEEGNSLNLTLSSATISDGARHPQFAQFAVLGGSAGRESVSDLEQFMTPLYKPEEEQRQLEGMIDAPPSSATHEASAVQQQAAAGITVQASSAERTSVGGDQAPVLAPAALGTVAGGTSSARTPLQVEVGAVLPMENTAAAVEAGAQAMRTAQETAVAQAAETARAPAVHAQQAHAPVHIGGPIAGKVDPSATAATATVGVLPTGGITGPLGPHGARASPLPTMAAGWGMGRGARGKAAAVATVGSGGVSGSLARGAYSGRVGGGSAAAPRRQRHKVSSKDLTEEQRIERRERNREHAKRSRVRKKFLLDSLQRSVDALQAENDSLKGSIVSSLGGRGRELVAKCVPEEVEGPLVTANPTQATKILDDPDYSLVKALQTAQQNFVITDASLPDNPIVFASGGFLELTGYKLTDVLGRNCRFLQGPETDPRAVDKIRNAIEEGSDASVCLLNYRADDTTFWNQFFVAALRDGGGNTVNYVGVQCKVGDDYARIVVSEQNRKLSAPAAARRGPPAGGNKQPSIPASPAAQALAGVVAAATAPGGEGEKMGV